jgi:hypothetical protein
LLRPIYLKTHLKFARDHVEKPLSYWSNVLWTIETKIELFGLSETNHVSRKKWSGITQRTPSLPSSTEEDRSFFGAHLVPMVLVLFIELMKSWWKRIIYRFSKVTWTKGHDNWVRGAVGSSSTIEILNIQRRLWLNGFRNPNIMFSNVHLSHQISTRSRIFGVNSKFRLTRGDQRIWLNWKLHARKNERRLLQITTTT